MKRLVDENLPDGNLLSKGQHSYNKGRSVETVLHSLVSRIEKSLGQREYTLPTFLNIDEAFNYVVTKCYIRGAGKVRCKDHYGELDI